MLVHKSSRLNTLGQWKRKVVREVYSVEAWRWGEVAPTSTFTLTRGRFQKSHREVATRREIGMIQLQVTSSSSMGSCLSRATVEPRGGYGLSALYLNSCHSASCLQIYTIRIGTRGEPFRMDRSYSTVSLNVMGPSLPETLIRLTTPRTFS
jgi:hypothetical protein